LREEYKTKLAKAVNLDALKKQREQVQQYVTQLEKQLPSKAEMDACCRTSTRPASAEACSLICSGPVRSLSGTTTPSCPSPCV
jgi:Tfp pilus assembly protein PilO